MSMWDEINIEDHQSKNPWEIEVSSEDFDPGMSMDVAMSLVFGVGILVVLVLLCRCCCNRRDGGRVLAPPTATAYPVQSASPYRVNTTHAEASRPILSPCPTVGSPLPAAAAPYPTGGVPNPTAGAPYPTAGAPYPTGGAPYPAAGAPYPTAGAPYPTAGAPYPTAGAPYPATALFPTPHAGAPVAPDTNAMPPSYEQVMGAAATLDKQPAYNPHH